MKASPLGPKSALPVTEQANPTHPAHPPGPTYELCPTQPTKPTPLSDLTNLDMDLKIAKTQSEGKWVRLQRPAHLKDSLNSKITLGKGISLDKLDSLVPPKRRACVGATQNENSLPAAEADLQPRQKR